MPSVVAGLGGGGDADGTVHLEPSVDAVSPEIVIQISAEIREILQVGLKAAWWAGWQSGLVLGIVGTFILCMLLLKEKHP